MPGPDDSPDPEPLTLYELALYDKSKIDFDALLDTPSSNVTMKQLREIYKNDHEDIVDEGVWALRAMQEKEHLLVLLGYASVLGKKASDQVSLAIPDKERLIQDYTDDLLRYGQADGPETARQIIRRLEETGAAIAREQLGRSRP